MPIYDESNLSKLAENTEVTSASSVPAGSITEVELTTSVAGNGLSGGGGSALSVNVDGTTIQITGDTLQVGEIETSELGSSFQTGTGVTNSSGISSTDTLASYTSDDQSTPYTGIDNTDPGTVYATVADLNTLRDAYQNQRALSENLAAVVLHLVGLLEDRFLIP